MQRKSTYKIEIKKEWRLTEVMHTCNTSIQERGGGGREEGEKQGGREEGQMEANESQQDDLSSKGSCFHGFDPLYT